jgi:hypothetical protein
MKKAARSRMAEHSDKIAQCRKFQKLTIRQGHDLSGASFNLRLPVSIKPPRFVRLGFRYEF